MAQAEHVLTVNTLRIMLYACVAFTVLFGIGVYGFLLFGSSWLQAIYGTVKLVLVDAPDTILQRGNWALVVAAFTLPLFPAAAILSLLGAAAGVQWQLLRVVAKPRRHVFLGAGKMAASVAQTLGARGEKSLIAIDQNIEGQHALSIAAQAGALVLQHDVNNSLLLRKLRLQRADTIYVFTGDDQQNLVIARKVIHQLKNARNSPRLVINIESANVLRLVTEEESFRAYQRKAELLWFSGPHQKAREITKRFPIRLVSSQQQPGPVHVGIVGQGADAEALLLQLAKQNSVLRNERLHITLLGSDPQRFAAFMLNYPMLSTANSDPEYGGVAPNIQLNFMQIGDAGVTPQVVRASIQAQQNEPFQVVYIIEPNDYQAITETVRMCQVMTAMNMTARVVTCIAGNEFESLAQVHKAVAHFGAALDKVTWFHALADLFDRHEHYPGELSDIFGLLVHSAYRAIYTEPPLQAHQANLQTEFEQRLHRVAAAAKHEWLTQLPEAFKASSRQSGDHIFVKLREIGFQLRLRKPNDEAGIEAGLLGELNTAISEHIDALLRLEHTRFTNERILDGWLFHASNDKSLKLNKTLIPFADLSPHEVLKDEVIIRVMPVLLHHPHVQQYYALKKI